MNEYVFFRKFFPKLESASLFSSKDGWLSFSLCVPFGGRAEISAARSLGKGDVVLRNDLRNVGDKVIEVLSLSVVLKQKKKEKR